MKNGLTKLFWIVLILVSNNAISRTISGKVIDASTKEPLVYVNIGIVGTTIGTITNLKGEFALNIENQAKNGIVRFSMIGYKSQEYEIGELRERELQFELIENAIHLDVITIKPKQFVEKRLGTKSSTKMTVAGWGGFGKGGELGLKIKVKKEVYLESLHFHIVNNVYDSILLRVHIRNLQNDLPSDELLKTEILIPVITKRGWVDVSLDKFGLSFEEDFVLTLEWVFAWGDFCNEGYCLNFSDNIFKGTLYLKPTSEADWIVNRNNSPGIYLNVLESK